ncbi:MAG: hypothetical protein GX621_13295 [Pirellulaceae bacterium]|nr:hypothetical protein [Pirellulaceae bacterium]
MMSEPSESQPEYRCPGESEPISRAMHLARLEALYPACARCPHKDDTGEVSSRRARHLAEAHRPPPSPALFDDEGISGVLLNELTPAVARRAAVAFGLHLREHNEREDWPRVVLAGDARRLTTPLVAAAADGLRFAGCHVTDIGQGTTGCLALAMHRSASDGGVLIGNATDRHENASLRFWHAGRPLSRGDELDELESRFDAEANRPTRRYGSLERVSFEAEYLTTLAGYYHGLRPLRVVLDTDCRPLVEYARLLVESLECRFLHDFDDSRPLADRVVANRAHFGVRIDGIGETCRAVDERGVDVPGERFLGLIAGYLLAQGRQRMVEGDASRPSETVCNTAATITRPVSEAAAMTTRPASDATAAPTLVLEDSARPERESIPQAMGYRVVRAAGRRGAMHRAMVAEAAPLGGGPSGRFWYSGPGHVVPDALVTLSLLLGILSQSDRPLSEVLDAASGRT